MPLYEYECGSCGKRFERIRKFSDPPLEVCPLCGAGPVRKLVSSPAIQFKGSGFYLTDYGRQGSDASKGGESKGAGDAKTSGDAKTGAEKKPGSDAKSGGDTKSSGETKAAAEPKSTKSPDSGKKD